MIVYDMSIPDEQLLLSTVMFNRFFQQQKQVISIKQGIYHYDEFNDIYNDFARYVLHPPFASLNDPFVYKNCHIRERQKLYLHIQNNIIEGVWCINDYITWLKRKNSTMINSLFWVLNDFIQANGAVIIGNKHFHKYMNTNWWIKLLERIY